LTGDALLGQGDLQAALENYRRAVALGRESLSANSDQPEVRHRLADSYTGLGSTFAAIHKTDDGLQNSLDAVQIRESLMQLDPADARYKAALASDYIAASGVARAAGQRKTASEFVDRARAMLESLLRLDPANALRRSSTTAYQQNGAPGS